MRAEASAPTSIATCWCFGVEPTRKPVFKSCDVVPPFEEATQTMPPIESAVTKYGGAVQPTNKKMRHVSNNVATVMPEFGVDDEPTSPVRREDTVVKRKPNATMRNAPSKLKRRFSCGATMMRMRSRMIPPTTHFIEIS